MKIILGLLSSIGIFSSASVSPVSSLENVRNAENNTCLQDKKVISDVFALKNEFAFQTGNIHNFLNSDDFYKNFKINLNILLTDAISKNIKNVRSFNILFLNESDEVVLDINSLTKTSETNLTLFFNKFLNLEDGTFLGLENGNISTIGSNYIEQFKAPVDGMINISFDVLKNNDYEDFVTSDDILLDYQNLKELNGNFKLEMNYEI